MKRLYLHWNIIRSVHENESISITEEVADAMFRYNIGDIFATIERKNPIDILHYGKWKLIEGYLYGADEGEDLYQIIGTDTASLSSENIPIHNHDAGNLLIPVHEHSIANHIHSGGSGIPDHQHPMSATTGYFKNSLIGYNVFGVESSINLATTFMDVPESTVEWEGSTNISHSVSRDSDQISITGESGSMGLSAPFPIDPLSITVYQWERTA